MLPPVFLFFKIPLNMKCIFNKTGRATRNRTAGLRIKSPLL